MTILTISITLFTSLNHARSPTWTDVTRRKAPQAKKGRITKNKEATECIGIHERKNTVDPQQHCREATVRKFRIVQKEGSRDVARNLDFYSLDSIIAVGFRVNSMRAVQFRQWATGVLRDFAIRGYVLDKERLKNGSHFICHSWAFSRRTDCQAG